ncbi:MAG: Gfo/Idh/MocA family oxidoreductase [Christensenellales bacterium]|jgi:predicted dehydrogenase/sugar phosphate isomerase/epimerase
MYLSVFTDELFMDAKAALPIIKSWGADYVDFRGLVNGKGIEYQTDEELSELKAQMDELGLKVGALQSSLCKVHLPDEDRQKKEMEKLEGLIRACEILDCKLVRSFFYWQPDEVDHSLFGQLAVRPDLMAGVLERFTPIKNRAREAGLIIGFENCGTTCDEVLAFLGALNVPEWGLAWDPSNDLSLIEEDRWAQHFAKCIKKSLLMHCKAVSIVDGMIKVKTPWERILRGVAASRKELPISVETHNPKNSPHTHEEASRLVFESLKKAWPSGAPGSIEEAVAVSEAEYPPCPFADNPVRFVVVGLGMGRNRVMQMIKNPAIKLLGVCDINLQKAKELGEQIGVKYSDDINVFLNDPQVEVMYIVTPTGLHCSIAEQCLNTGKHVLTTKPMDVSVENCDSAIRLAKEKGLLLGVDFDMRHTAQMMELVEASKRGWFGRILSANINLYIDRKQKYYDENGAWRGTWRYDGGGSMCNQGVHEIDRLLEVIGMPLRVRAGIATQTHFIETEDYGWSEWDYGNGMVVRFASTTSYPVPTWYARIEIHGTAGAYVYTNGGPEGNHTWWAKDDGTWHEKAPYPFVRRWRAGSDNFANSVRTGEHLSISGDVGRKSRLILDAIYDSARGDGDWVDVKK